MKHNLLFFLLILLLCSCKEPEARRPKQHSTKSFYNELIAKNKQLIKEENQWIKDFIRQDTLTTYKTSASGFWYSYTKRIENENSIFPKAEDRVEIEYNITDLEGNELYPNQKKIYKIDKEDFIPALQDGIKLMKVGETITFVIPSYRGFGIAGDGNKIGINQTIKSTLTLINIKSNKTNEN